MRYAREDELTLPLAELARHQRVGGSGYAGVNLAAAESAYRAALAAAGRTQSLAEARADAQQQAQRAASQLTALTQQSAEDYEPSSLPGTLAPSPAELGALVEIPAGGFAVPSFSAWDDPWSTDWYDGYWLGNYWPDGYAQPYGGSDWGGGGAAGWAGAWGAWSLYADGALYGVPSWGWGLWNAWYTGVSPQLPSADQTIDVLADVNRYESHVEGAAQVVWSVIAALTPIDEVKDIAVNAATGLIVIGASAQLATASPYGNWSFLDNAEKYGATVPSIVSRFDHGGGTVKWDGRTVLKTLEQMDPTALQFLTRYGRLQVASDGSLTPTYAVYEALRGNNRLTPWPGGDPLGNFNNLLTLKSSDPFLIVIEIPESYNDLQAMAYLLGLLTNQVDEGAGLDPLRVAKLYGEFARDQISRNVNRDNVAHEALVAQTFALAVQVAEMAKAYGEGYYSTVGGITAGGGFAYGIVVLQRQGLLAGAIELALNTPIGEIAGQAVSKLKILKIGEKVVGQIPTSVIRFFQSGRAVGADELRDALRLAAKNGDDKAALDAWAAFRAANAHLIPLIKDPTVSRAILREAMDGVPPHYLTEGVGLAATRPAAHHLVPVQLFNKDLGKRLHEMGIDLNGVENGVWLPTEEFEGRIAALHRGNHQGALTAADDTLLPSYVNFVQEQFNGVTTREQALKALDEIREALLNGTQKLYREKVR
jgi:hypothetical protein